MQLQNLKGYRIPAQAKAGDVLLVDESTGKGVGVMSAEEAAVSEAEPIRDKCRLTKRQLTALKILDKGRMSNLGMAKSCSTSKELCHSTLSGLMRREFITRRKGQDRHLERRSWIYMITNKGRDALSQR
jgi:predicted transcriptional regulator